jgi:hypothetical protein
VLFCSSYIIVASIGSFSSDSDLSTSADQIFKSPKLKTNFLSNTKLQAASELLKDNDIVTATSTIKAQANQNKRPKIWVSMGLCFSETTQKYGKKNYPYAEVTPLGILLWNYFFPNTDDVGIILFLIYTEQNITAHMETYEKMLIPTGVHYKWVHADGMDCVMKAQLVRMFAFGHPLVQPKDIVVTVDVNFFLMTDKIFDPIYDNPDMLAWIYQYDKSAFEKARQGESFNQVCNFIYQFLFSFNIYY